MLVFHASPVYIFIIYSSWCYSLVSLSYYYPRIMTKYLKKHERNFHKMTGQCFLTMKLISNEKNTAASFKYVLGDKNYLKVGN